MAAVVLCGAGAIVLSGLENASGTFDTRRRSFAPAGFSAADRRALVAERRRRAKLDAAAVLQNRSAPAPAPSGALPSLLAPPPQAKDDAERSHGGRGEKRRRDAPAAGPGAGSTATTSRAGFSATSRDFSTSPSFSATQHYGRSLRHGAADRLSRYSDVCIDYKGTGGSGAGTSGPRLGEAWLCGAGQRGTRPSLRLTRNLVWRPERATGRGCRDMATRRLGDSSGVTWLVDISHGPSRSWSNICHWADTMFPFFSAVHALDTAAADAAAGAAATDGPAAVHQPSVPAAQPLPPLHQVALPQVPNRGQFLSPRGSFSDWFSKTMNVILTYHNGAPLKNYSSLLYQSDFWGRTVCFAELATIDVDFLAPHFYSARGAHAWRDAALAFLQLPPLQPIGAHAASRPSQTTLLLRTGDRTITNEGQLIGGLDALLRGEGRAPSAVVRLQGTLPFRWQVALYANTSLLISTHGAQLTNVVFMPDDGAVIELLTCGYYSDTYRKFAVEAGLYYLASRDPAPGCDADLGKKHHNDDRPVSMRELRPVVLRALHRNEPASENTSSPPR